MRARANLSMSPFMRVPRGHYDRLAGVGVRYGFRASILPAVPVSRAFTVRFVARHAYTEKFEVIVVIVLAAAMTGRCHCHAITGGTRSQAPRMHAAPAAPPPRDACL